MKPNMMVGAGIDGIREASEKCQDSGFTEQYQIQSVFGIELNTSKKLGRKITGDYDGRNRPGTCMYYRVCL